MNSLAVKLLIKPNNSVFVLNSPKNISTLFRDLPKGTTLLKKIGTPCDVVVLFAKNEEELNTYGPRAWASVKDGGIFWIVIPRRNTTMQETIATFSGWDIINSMGLKIVSHVPINATWTAYRFKPKSVRISSAEHQQEAGLKEFIDEEKKTVTLPKDFADRLAGNRKAKDFFETLSFANRREYVVWILKSKTDKARAKRLDLIMEKLKSGLKNPREIPS